MSDEVARRECESLARALPHGLRLDRLEMHAYGCRTHRVARFSRRDTGDSVYFVLVPGGEVALGFDGEAFEPSVTQLASFARSAERYDIDPSIKSFVNWQTSDRRTAYIPSFLVEVEAQEIARRQDLEELDHDHPLFKKFDREHPENGRSQPYGGILGEYSYVVERSDTGLRVRRRPPTTVRYVEQRLAGDGMRLPTCDEWEYACGAGATTLFRWGNDNPHDFYPTDTCAEDARLAKEWVLSGGTLKYETPPPTWDLHEQLNLFGIRIANNPYQRDLVSDGPRQLGGDGGCNVCGGAGFFLGWLTLATAYRDRWGMKITEHTNVADEYHRVRRVISIP